MLAYWPFLITVLYIAGLVFVGWAIAVAALSLRSMAQSFKEIADTLKRRDEV